MANIPIINNLRVVPRDSDFLGRKLGSRGEIYFDQDNNTLRLYDGNTSGGTSLAKNDLSNVSNSDFSAKATAAGIGSGGSGNTTVTVGTSLPSSPENGNLWLNTNNGVLYVYINDGDTNQWIQPSAPTPVIKSSNLDNDAGFITEFSSIFGDDSTLLVDAENSVLNTSALSQSGATAGQFLSWTGDEWAPDDIEFGSFSFTGSNIDTTDSSAITVTPVLTLESDLNVQNDINANNLNLTGTITGLSSSDVGLENVTNESKTTMFTDSTFTGSTTINTLSVLGTTILQQSVERMTTKTGITSTTDFDFESGSVWFLYDVTTDFTANFINVPSDTESTVSFALIINQQATAYLPTAVQINGSSQSILWQEGSQPSANAEANDIVSFTLIYTGSTWEVLGSLTTYS